MLNEDEFVRTDTRGRAGCVLLIVLNVHHSHPASSAHSAPEPPYSSDSSGVSPFFPELNSVHSSNNTSNTKPLQPLLRLVIRVRRGSSCTLLPVPIPSNHLVLQPQSTRPSLHPTCYLPLPTFRVPWQVSYPPPAPGPTLRKTRLTQSPVEEAEALQGAVALTYKWLHLSVQYLPFLLIPTTTPLTRV